MTTYAEARTTLPVGAVLDELAERLADGDAVLEAPPGAGKTTLVPLALRDAAWLGGRTILEDLGMDVHVLCEFEGA